MVTQDRIRLTGLLREKPWKRGFFYGPDSPATRQASPWRADCGLRGTARRGRPGYTRRRSASHARRYQAAPTHLKGGKPRRQPLPAGLARELLKLRDHPQPEPTDRSSAGSPADACRRRSSPTSSAAPARAPESPSTSLPTPSATRPRLGFDKSSATPASRYAHVDREELFDAAGWLEQLAAAPDETAAPTDARSAKG
jgi:hypothetical protein